MSLADRIATPDEKRRCVRALCATIADRYDLITVSVVGLEITQRMTIHHAIRD
jgi:hypothetical protein